MLILSLILVAILAAGGVYVYRNRTALEAAAAARIAAAKAAAKAFEQKLL